MHQRLSRLSFSRTWAGSVKRGVGVAPFLGLHYSVYSPCSPPPVDTLPHQGAVLFPATKRLIGGTGLVGWLIDWLVGV